MNRTGVIALCVLLGISGALAQWSRRGSYNGTVTSLAAGGGVVYAATAGGGVLRSLDNGASWEAAGTGLGNSDVRSLAYRSPYTFAGTAGGVFRLSDGESGWSNVTNVMNPSSVSALGSSGMTLFCATTQGGVWRSAEYGINWIPVSNGLTQMAVRSLGFSTTKILAGTSSGLFTSSIWTIAWSLSSSIPAGAIPSVSSAGDFAVAGSAGQGVFRSLDGGNAWVAAGLANATVHALTVHNAIVYAGTADGVFLSRDSAVTWVDHSDGLETRDIRSLLVAGTTLLAGTVSGVYAGPVGGETGIKDVPGAMSGRVPLLVSPVLIQREGSIRGPYLTEKAQFYRLNGSKPGLAR